MTDTSAALPVLLGLVVRLMIPVLLTAALVMLLSRLDRRWRTEGSTLQVRVKKPDCWKIQNCATVQRKDCPGFKSAAPCWQAFRQSNGYLGEKCIGCPVLAAAPVPAAY